MNKIKLGWQPSKNQNQTLKYFSFSQWILLGFLLLLIIMGAIPNYLSNKWSWAQPPQIQNIKYIKNLSKTGLTLPSYQEVKQEQFSLGNQEWSAQLLQKQEQSLVLFLMPQDYYTNLPETEWLDLKYLENWKIDSQKNITVPIQEQSSSYSVVARYFKAWAKTTFIIVQWYAWPSGGSYSSHDWFWQDQGAQLKRQRLPWIAVSLKIPVEPNTVPKTKLSEIKAIVNEVQTSLEKQVFNRLQS
ncbi:cyanoexosortase B system-associated protein [Aphanothece hegewaldii CCALA 016]|uniref:Cyanoexosortase B system-associated protein n=1 Tax=Aphanothece hegewaldii CCALA 016 TaxID=2107694 RepID=A0A2T1M1R0_9CHRO|nr:cyanoexosortase B system-associated protein [Aphanothece hegewaldii]PSF38630.1 cyanoexosortase B system-associated protein [Aphanothece hegewaldii CCALA 016]